MCHNLKLLTSLNTLSNWHLFTKKRTLAFLRKNFILFKKYKYFYFFFYLLESYIEITSEYRML